MTAEIAAGPDTSIDRFPATPEEAFLTTGRPIFDRDRLMIWHANLEKYDLEAAAGKHPIRFVRGRLQRQRDET